MKFGKVFETLFSALPPIPAAELPHIRHVPMEGNEELSFWGDLKYLHDLKLEIFDELRDAVWGGDSIIFNASEGDLYAEMCWWFDPPNSQFFPDDIAATQLACWRQELDGGEQAA